MKRLTVLAVLVSAFTVLLAQDRGSIEYFGQAAFRIVTADGVQIVIDPAEFKGYSMPEYLTADIVTMSHEHMDHNNMSSLAPGFVQIHGCTPDNQALIPVDTTIDGVHIYNISSYHNPGKHALNAVFVYDFDDVRLAHLGDIGTTLTSSQIVAIGDLDILVLPVGGHYTIGLKEAHEIVGQLAENTIVIPMHFKTEAFDYLPNTADDFLKDLENVVRVRSHRMEIPELTDSTGVVYYLLDYLKN